MESEKLENQRNTILQAIGQLKEEQENESHEIKGPRRKCEKKKKQR